MADVTLGTGRVAGAFDAGHDRLNELREILGIVPPTPSVTRDERVAVPTVDAVVEVTAPRAPRGRSLDPRNPADLLLVVLWTSMIGLLTAAFLATS